MRLLDAFFDFVKSEPDAFWGGTVTFLAVALVCVLWVVITMGMAVVVAFLTLALFFGAWGLAVLLWWLVKHS